MLAFLEGNFVYLTPLSIWNFRFGDGGTINFLSLKARHLLIQSSGHFDVSRRRRRYIEIGTISSIIGFLGVPYSVSSKCVVEALNICEEFPDKNTWGEPWPGQSSVSTVRIHVAE